MYEGMEQLKEKVQVMYNDDTHTAIVVLRSNGAVIAKYVKKVIIPIWFFFTGMASVKEEYVTNWVLGNYGEEVERNLKNSLQTPANVV